MGRSRQACSDNRGSLVPKRRASQGSSAVGSRSAASVATPNICVVSQQAVETRHPGRRTRATRSRYRKGEERATDSQRRQFGHSPQASPGRQMRCAATTFTWGRLGDLNPGPTHYEPFASPQCSRSYSCTLRLAPACSAMHAPCSGAYPGHLDALPTRRPDTYPAVVVGHVPLTLRRASRSSREADHDGWQRLTDRLGRAPSSSSATTTSAPTPPSSPPPSTTTSPTPPSSS